LVLGDDPQWQGIRVLIVILLLAILALLLIYMMCHQCLNPLRIHATYNDYALIPIQVSSEEPSSRRRVQVVPAPPHNNPVLAFANRCLSNILHNVQCDEGVSSEEQPTQVEAVSAIAIRPSALSLQRGTTIQQSRPASLHRRQSSVAGMANPSLDTISGSLHDFPQSPPPMPSLADDEPIITFIGQNQQK